MEAHLSIPPFAAQAQYSGHVLTDLVVAWIDPDGGSLWTTLFYESGNADEPVRFLKAVDWEVAPPPGAAVFVVAGARSIDELGTAWVGFRHDGALSAMSLLKEELITVPLGEADRVIGPPWVDPEGRLHVLAFSPDKAGWVLVDHRIEAAATTPVRIDSHRHLTVRGAPLVAQVLLIPGEADVVLGWVEASESGLSVQLAELGSRVRLLASVPVRGAITLPQRLGLHRAPNGTLRASFVVTREPDAALHGVEVLKPADDEASARSWLLNVRAAATAGAYIGENDPRPLRLFLTADGELLQDGRPVRRDLDSTYPFPVFTTAQDIYEVGFDADGRPHIVPFR